ncbi:hypothetical protein BaRGS_00009948 [Batillaria attramentaria]|uniref:Uncharacterized protein n=1 Tax=Batillaria attramentaria TaxID=370345 RepID=A0ABD0LI01_9CAEN
MSLGQFHSEKGQLTRCLRQSEATARDVNFSRRHNPPDPAGARPFSVGEQTVKMSTTIGGDAQGAEASTGLHLAWGSKDRDGDRSSLPRMRNVYLSPPEQTDNPTPRVLIPSTCSLVKVECFPSELNQRMIPGAIIPSHHEVICVVATGWSEREVTPEKLSNDQFSTPLRAHRPPRRVGGWPRNRLLRLHCPLASRRREAIRCRPLAGTSPSGTVKGANSPSSRLFSVVGESTPCFCAERLVNRKRQFGPEYCDADDREISIRQTPLSTCCRVKNLKLFVVFSLIGSAQFDSH